MKKIAGAVCLLFVATQTSVAIANGPAVVAKVKQVGTYEHGSVFVFFDRPISTCSDTNRLDVEATIPAVKAVFAVATTAFATGSSVVVHPGACNGTKPTFTTDGDSYIYLTT